MLIHILIIILMVILKGIFSAGDTALTYIDRERLNSKVKKDVRAR
jgi:Mg2+/Co2+ transporter CorB